MNLWCEVSKDVLISNALKAKERTNKKIMAVVKGNAYGLGLESVSNILDSTVDYFGVATLQEAISLKTQKDILIMSPLCEVSEVEIPNIIYTIDDVADLYKFNKNHNYRVHIYINTGMNRLGVEENDVPSLIEKIKKEHSNIVIDGLYTHLNNASDLVYSKKQIDSLKRVSEMFPFIKNIHCLNSKGISSVELINYSNFTNIARAGNILYGYEGLSIGFKKAFTIKARVCKRFDVGNDGFIGYGNKFSVKRGTTVGIIPCGTIDKIGYIRNIKTNIIKDILKVIRGCYKKSSFLYHHGKPVYTICSPNMNATLIDISHLKNIDDIVLDVAISSLLLDSSVPRVYI